MLSTRIRISTTEIMKDREDGFHPGQCSGTNPEYQEFSDPPDRHPKDLRQRLISRLPAFTPGLQEIEGGQTILWLS